MMAKMPCLATHDMDAAHITRGGVAVLLIFLRGVAVNKIPACGIAVIPNPAVCDVCVF